MPTDRELTEEEKAALAELSQEEKAALGKRPQEEAQEAEPEEDSEIAEVEDEVEEYEVLPDYYEQVSPPNEGFDFFKTVHADLKAAGYSANQGETKDLLNYIHQAIVRDTFENGEHKIPNLGTLTSDVKEHKERTATFDMPSGVAKGETYMTKAKHVFALNTSASKKYLAEISEIPGWEPEAFLEPEEAEEAEEK